jgi:hypothetical protein
MTTPTPAPVRIVVPLPPQALARLRGPTAEIENTGPAVHVPPTMAQKSATDAYRLIGAEPANSARQALRDRLRARSLPDAPVPVLPPKPAAISPVFSREKAFFPFSVSFKDNTQGADRMTLQFFSDFANDLVPPPTSLSARDNLRCRIILQDFLQDLAELKLHALSKSYTHVYVQDVLALLKKRFQLQYAQDERDFGLLLAKLASDKDIRFHVRITEEDARSGRLDYDHVKLAIAINYELPYDKYSTPLTDTLIAAQAVSDRIVRFRNRMIDLRLNAHDEETVKNKTWIIFSQLQKEGTLRTPQDAAETQYLFQEFSRFIQEGLVVERNFSQFTRQSYAPPKAVESAPVKIQEPTGAEGFLSSWLTYFGSLFASNQKPEQR